MLFLMVFGKYPEKFSLGIFFPLRPDYRSNTIRLYMYTQRRVTCKPAINHSVSKSVLLSILYLFINILIEFLNYELSTIFTIFGIISVYIQPRYFYPIFRSVCANNMNRVILHCVRPLF